MSFKSSQGSCKFLKTRFLKTPPCSTGTGAVRSPGVPGSPRGSLGPLGSVLRRFRKLLRVFRVFFRRKAIEKVRESRRKFETVRDSLRKLKKVCEIMKTIWILDMDGPGERRGYQPSSTFFNLLDSTSYRVEGWGGVPIGVLPGPRGTSPSTL